MVSDKYQVRATGTVNPLTRQPIKGRKKGGGIRLGEMERDSLLSHGTAFLLHDRLLNCSDRHIAFACRRCGDLLSPATERSTLLSAGQKATDATKHHLRVFCRNAKCCNAVGEESNDDSVQPVILPYVYRYLQMLLYTKNETFPCAPSRWQDKSFDNLFRYSTKGYSLKYGDRCFKSMISWRAVTMEA